MRALRTSTECTSAPGLAPASPAWAATVARRYFKNDDAWENPLAKYATGTLTQRWIVAAALRCNSVALQQRCSVALEQCCNLPALMQVLGHTAVPAALRRAVRSSRHRTYPFQYRLSTPFSTPYSTPCCTTIACIPEPARAAATARRPRSLRVRMPPNGRGTNLSQQSTTKHTSECRGSPLWPAVLACRRRRGTRGGVVWQDGSSPPPYLMRMRKYGYPPGYTGAPSLCFGADGRT